MIKLQESNTLESQENQLNEIKELSKRVEKMSTMQIDLKEEIDNKDQLLMDSQHKLKSDKVMYEG